MADNFTVIARGWSEMAAELQARLLKRVRPGSDLFARGIFAATVLTHRLAINYTHVITSALKHSHRVDFNAHSRGGPEGVVFVGDIQNPRTGISTSFYGIIEESRGGDHEFYGQIINNDLEQLGEEFWAVFGRGL